MQNAGMKTGCQKYVPTFCAGTSHKSNCIEVSFILLFDDALLMEFMYLVFTCMPGGSHCKWLGSLLLCLHEVFWALINSLVCWFFILCMFQAFQYDNNDINTKYCVLQMMHENMDTPEGQGSLTIKTNEEIRWAHINSLSTVPFTRNLFFLLFFTVWKSKIKQKSKSVKSLNESLKLMDSQVPALLQARKYATHCFPPSLFSWKPFSDLFTHTVWAYFVHLNFQHMKTERWIQS